MAFRISDGNALEQIVELAAGYGIGGAVGTSLEPLLQSLRNRLFALDPSMPLDPQILGLLVRMGALDTGTAATEAAHSGTNPENLARLVAANYVVPSPGELIELVRRGAIPAAGLQGLIELSGVDPRFSKEYATLLRAHLSPAEAALARQQGYITPEAQHAAAALWGIDAEDAEIQWEIVGLPPGPQEALDMVRRGLMDEGTFRQVIAEGHTKTKYADVYLETLRPRLGPGEIVNAAIRQWITQGRMTELLAEYGYDPEQAQLLYDQHGRPPGPSQLQTAYNRGLINRGRFDKGIAESDVRVEWADVEFGLRRRYPTLFQLKNLVSTGGLSPERALEILGYEGYEPQDAKAMVAAWKGGAASKGKDLAKSEIVTLYEGQFIDRAKAHELLIRYGFDTDEADLELEISDARRIRAVKNAFIGRVNASYVSHKIDRDTAVNDLDTLGMPAEARDNLLTLWDVERELNKLVLTPGEIIQLAHRAVVTPQVAQAMLVARGADDMTAWLKLASHLGTIPGSPVESQLQTVPSV